MKFLLPAALSASFLAGEASAAVKVMPFGASIVTSCWRAILWKKLQDAGIKDIDFVGGEKGKDCGIPYDGDHEGHPGARATEFVEKNQVLGWMAKSKPDVIVMHLGTNDVIQNFAVEDIIDAYNTMVDQMRESKANMQIIVSLLLPLAERFGSAVQGIVELNEAIVKWAPTKTTRRSPIYLVDNFAGFNTTTDTLEGQHPNTAGDQKMADKFYPAVRDAVRVVTIEEPCPPWMNCWQKESTESDSE